MKNTIPKTVVSKGHKGLREVYCKAKDGTLCWAFKNDNIVNEVPNILYEVSNNYQMLKKETKHKFGRWATPFDV